jgi:SNF family Na+-dependent transporter
VLVLTAAWVVCFLALFRGVKMSGKIVYFTAIFPYLVLLILGIYGWTLEGADLGVYYFIYPDMEKLKDVIIWKEAAVQVFFTLSLSYGGNIALASYNNFQNNILR